jgi:GNAT superfamily N-acetyltransferase
MVKSMSNQTSAILYHLHCGSLDLEVGRSIQSLAQAIFSTLDIEKFKARTKKSDLVLICAMSGDEIIAFKMGYPLDDKIFYSWLGGTLPMYRKQGIGYRLMTMQHEWCRQNGYSTIRTKTMNQWRAMLILNLRNGFVITDILHGNDGKQRIVMEKTL